jgi:hypothetical protein
MYENIREYRDRGVINYLGKPDSVYVTAGKERVKVNWWLNNDPRIRFCHIYWNEGGDSIIVPVDRNTMDESGYVSTIVDIPEGNYVFLLSHTASDGERSIESEAIGTSYGTGYESKLITRRIVNVTIRSGILEINWRPAEENESQTTIEYLSASGTTTRLTVKPEDTHTTLDGYMLENGIFSFLKKSSYLPEPHALDTFTITSQEAITPEIYQFWLDKTDWTAEVSSTFNSGEYQGPRALVDNNEETKWHCGLSEVHPHWFIIDMQANKLVKQFDIMQHPVYLYVKSMKVQLSKDRENWTDIGTMTHTNNPRTSIVLNNLTEARYIRVQTVEGYTNHANIAEVYVYGAD